MTPAEYRQFATAPSRRAHAEQLEAERKARTQRVTVRTVHTQGART